MTEYIDREEFIQHIEESDLPDMAKRAVIALVKHMPTADVCDSLLAIKLYCEQHPFCDGCALIKDNGVCLFADGDLPYEWKSP